MLLFLRSTVSKLVMKILFVVLVASFAVWGIGDIFRTGDRSGAPIEVGPIQVSQNQLQDEYRRQFTQLQARAGSQFDAEMARALGLPQRVVDDMVTRALFAVFTDEIGMKVADETVLKTIQADSGFRNTAGQFDRSRFEAWLRQNGMSEGALVSRLRADIARNHLTLSMVAGVQPPDSLVNAIHAYRAEERVAETLRVSAGAVEIGTPDDAALTTFYEENADRYQAPEYRAVTLVRLSATKLASDISISDEEIAAAFESRKSEFGQPERRHVEQVVLPDEITAKGAAEELASGVAFAELARKATGSEPVDLGTVDKAALSRLVPQLADAAFSTPEGEVSAPVETALGWHLVHVISVEPGREATLAEHRDAIAQELALQQAQNSIVEIANQLEDELAGGATLEDAAAKLDLELVKIPAMDAQGRAPDGSAIELGPDSGAPAIAFETPEGEQSPLTASDDGGYFILRVDEVMPAATRPLADVRDRVVEDWQAAQRAAAAEARAKELVERIDAGETMAAIATELGQEVRTSKPLTRDATDPSATLDSAAVATLFNLQEGEVAAAPAGEDQVIVRLVEIREPSETADPTATAALSDELRGAMAAEMVGAFMTAVQEDVPVSVDRQAIEALF